MSGRCDFCGRADLSDPVIREAYVREIREQSRERLHRVESVLRTLPTADRVAVAQFVRRSLTRPPLDGSVAGWEAMREFFDALWWDVYDMTDDPTSPVVDGMVVPQPHPDLL